MGGTVSNDLQRRQQQQSGEVITTKKLSPPSYSGYLADKFERSKEGEPLGVENTSSHSEICYTKSKLLHYVRFTKPMASFF